MKIAVDIDGVILDLIDKVCEIFNEPHGTTYTKNNIRRWEFFRDWNIPEKEIYEIFENAYERTMTIPIIDESIPHVLQKITNIYHVDLVTARTKTFEKLLVKRLNSLKIKRITHYRNLIYVEPKPYDLKLSLDYDIFIDDNPNFVKSIKNVSGKKLYLYNQPWNDIIKENRNVKRVYSWKQIESILL